MGSAGAASADGRRTRRRVSARFAAALADRLPRVLEDLSSDFEQHPVLADIIAEAGAEALAQRS